MLAAAPKYPSFKQYDSYHNSSVRAYQTMIVLPLIAFNTVEAALFTVKASVRINSKILTFKSGDTYEFLNYKRTINKDGSIDAIDYNFSNFSLVGRVTPNESVIMDTSNAKILTKYYFDFNNSQYTTEECIASLVVLNNLQTVPYNPIDGFDLGVAAGKDYLLCLAIEIPFVGNTLDCNIEVHDFITDLASYQKITPSVIYPYKPIGPDGPGVDYIPDTGDNELIVGAV